MADVRLTFDADTRAAERNVSGLAERSEDLADALGSLNDTDADRALRDVEDAADDAADSARDLADDLKEIEDAAPDDVGRKMGDDLEDGFKRAGEGADDFKDEAASSAREGAASFSGEFEDVADFIQETLANALSGFGPVGAAAGLAAAAGVGILVSSLQDSAEQAEEAKERVVDLADQIREVDGDLSRLNTDEIFLDWSGQIGDTKQWFELWQDAPVTNIEQLASAAETLGVSMGDLRAALEDVDGPEAARVEELLTERLGTGIGATIASTDEATQSLIALRDAIADGSLDLEQATELYGLQNEALADNAAAIEYARESTETYNESIQDALTEAGDKWTEYTEDGKVNLAEYAQAMEDQIAAVERYEQNMVTASQTLTDEALAYLQNMGVEAAPLLQAFVDAPLSEQQRLNGIWSQLGTSAVDGYSDSVAGLTDATNDAVSTASANADPVEIGYRAPAFALQKVVNDDLSRVLTPYVKVRYTSTNAVGVGYRRV